MTITVGNLGLIEDQVLWKVAAGAEAYAGPFLLQDATPAPIDLTGYTGACEIRTKAGGPLLATAVVQIDGPAGKVLVHLPAAASAAWPARQTSAVFDAELTDPAGVVVRLCTGTLEISPNTTTGAP